jgi:PAT family beta-lactamase induction signal transducer AmpG
MLKQKSVKNFLIIFFLGISSGLPLALILSTLKALLLDKGFDLKTIGFFSLISLPYTLKFCFAPIIDSCSIPFLTKLVGQRKSWIILSQIFLVIFIIKFIRIYTYRIFNIFRVIVKKNIESN